MDPLKMRPPTTPLSATPVQGTLFSETRIPLAERMRPKTLDQFLGQNPLLKEGRSLRLAIQHDRVPSMILWGPPGCGKTTLALIIATHTGARFIHLSAVESGVRELRKIVADAKAAIRTGNQRTILFIDEVHRYNKSQQDALLPHVEDGTITLIGATTENPGFELNKALLSRCRVFRMTSLEEEVIGSLLNRALTDPVNGLGSLNLAMEPEAEKILVAGSMGDARRALNSLETAANLALMESEDGAEGHGGAEKGESTPTGGQEELGIEPGPGAAQPGNTITARMARESLAGRRVLYDKKGEEHYNLVSAFIKAMRGSDPDGAIYWAVRMLEGGEDPRFIVRRMVIFASEDVGNADPRALEVAINALHAVELVGLPEGVLPIVQAIAYLALAPKSNSVLKAYAAARKDVLNRGSLPPPLRLLNASNSVLKSMGYGAGYRYPHNFEGQYVPESYLPEQLEGSMYYHPNPDSGLEKTLAERLAQMREQMYGKNEPSD